MSDDAIETVAQRLYEADGGTEHLAQADEDDAQMYRRAAEETADMVSRIGLTPDDLAGLADGTHVVVPVEPTMTMVNRAWTVTGGVKPGRPEPAFVYRAMISARPAAKETDHGA
jgi:hypothetical protein